MSIIPNNWKGNIIPCTNSLNKLIDSIKPTKKGVKLLEIKNKLLIKKYGKYRLIKKAIQFNTFIKTSKAYYTLANDVLLVNGKISILIKLMKYLEYNIDIFTHLDSFYSVLIKKIKEFYIQDYKFDIFLYSFNINCNIITQQGNLCKKPCYLNFYQCKQHLQIKLKNEIKTYLTLRKVMPVPLIGIINKYAHGISYY